MLSASFGKTYCAKDYDKALENLEDGVIVERPTDLISRAARLICDGGVVAWFDGGSEIGPRALGRRSILAHPGLPGMKDRLNASVKFREPFRPYAPSVPQDKSAHYFSISDSPFMLLTGKVADPIRISEVAHVDGTARVQTVTREENSRYYDLHLAFERISGLPVLLNTSFNMADEPLVETPEDAANCFLRMGIDALAFPDRIIIKRSNPNSRRILELTRLLNFEKGKTAKYEAELELIRRSKGWRLLGFFNRIRRYLFQKKELDIL
jgi:carbamoyltransferase